MPALRAGPPVLRPISRSARVARCATSIWVRGFCRRPCCAADVPDRIYCGRGAVILEFTREPPMWVHMIIWLPLATVLTLVSLPPLKGLAIALQFTNRAEQGRVEQRGADPHPTSRRRARRMTGIAAHEGRRRTQPAHSMDRLRCDAGADARARHMADAAQGLEGDPHRHHGGAGIGCAGTGGDIPRGAGVPLGENEFRRIVMRGSSSTPASFPLFTALREGGRVDDHHRLPARGRCGAARFRHSRRGARPVARSRPPCAGQITGPVEITGRLRADHLKGGSTILPNEPARNVWYSRDLAQMAARQCGGMPADAAAVRPPSSWSMLALPHPADGRSPSRHRSSSPTTTCNMRSPGFRSPGC